jgi:hypothetical protein
MTITELIRVSLERRLPAKFGLFPQICGHCRRMACSRSVRRQRSAPWLSGQRCDQLGSQLGKSGDEQTPGMVLRDMLGRLHDPRKK